MLKTFPFIFSALFFAPVAAFADALEGKESPAEIIARAGPDDWRILEQDNLLYLDFDLGRVIIELSPALARGHVEQMRTLARERFYDGLSFYRVIDGFVAQGGDLFEEHDLGSAKKRLDAEFVEPMRDDIDFRAIPDDDSYSPSVGFIDGFPTGADPVSQEIWHLHCAGAFAMARSEGRNTARAEFYVTLQPQRYLDRNLTVFGKVVHGMEHLQALRRVPRIREKDADHGELIHSMRIGSAVPESEQVTLRVMDTRTALFADYLESRRNRPEAFFYYRPDHIDVCQLAIPVEIVEPQDTAAP
ncbi:MAG: peptidylprolyl isomerase [Pseudomonadota bacterium]